MKFILLAVIIFFISISCNLSYAQDATTIATIRSIEGIADILRSGNDETTTINEKDPVYVGDRIRTKSYSKVEVDFIDKSLVRIAPNSCVTIEEYTLTSNNKREHANIKLTRGKVEAIVAKTSRPDTFQVTTPNAVGKIKGSDIFVFFQAGKTGALVRDGSMSLSNTALPKEEFTLGRGDASLVPFQDKPLEPRPYLEAELNRHRKDVQPALTKKWIPTEGAAQMTASITTLTGEGARIFKKGATDWRPARINETIQEGDKLHTAELGTCEVRLSNGNALLLQPNTELAITSLKFDPSTGEFDNIFESSGGKIKAIVAKLGKQSTFQVKTPTAICGARGTIMYLNIQQTSTQAFYEGGSGFMTNTVSDKTEDIGAGQNSTSDVSGSITPPAITSDSQRMTMDQTFSGQDTMNEYSTPVGSTAPTGEGGAPIGPPPGGQTQGGELGQGPNTIIGGVDNPMSDPILPFVTNPNNPQGPLPPPPPGVYNEILHYSTSSTTGFINANPMNLNIDLIGKTWNADVPSTNGVSGTYGSVGVTAQWHLIFTAGLNDDVTLTGNTSLPAAVTTGSMVTPVSGIIMSGPTPHKLLNGTATVSYTGNGGGGDIKITNVDGTWSAI